MIASIIMGIVIGCAIGFPYLHHIKKNNLESDYKWLAIWGCVVTLPLMCPAIVVFYLVAFCIGWFLGAPKEGDVE